MLFTGDALMRALAADLLSGDGPMKLDPGWTSPFLVEAFNDNYPIVRFFAANGLAAFQSTFTKPDYLGSTAVRDYQLNQLRELMFARDPEISKKARLMAGSLAARRHDVDVEVGE